VDISTRLIDEINDLLTGIEVDPQLLLEPLRALRRDFRLAVRSYIGLQLTAFAGSHPVQLTSMEALADFEVITTSMQLSLQGVGRNRPSTVVAFATRPGAFVDLAANISPAHKLRGGELLLDRHIPASDQRSGFSGLREASTINRAIGVLIDSGRDLRHAEAELQRLADQAEITVQAQSERLIRGTVEAQSEVGMLPGSTYATATERQTHE
jgi:hypothetical protein